MTHSPTSGTDAMTNLYAGLAVLYDRVVLRHPKTIILAMLLAIGFLAFEARKFGLDASAETLVLEEVFY